MQETDLADHLSQANESHILQELDLQQDSENVPNMQDSSKFDHHSGPQTNSPIQNSELICQPSSSQRNMTVPSNFQKKNY